MQFTFQGKRRELRRLGLSDIFEVQRIVNDVMIGADIRHPGAAFGDGNEDFVSQVIAFIVAGGDFAEERVTDWLQSLFVEPLDEGEQIYLPGLVELISALIEHPDIKAFLESGEAAFRKLMEKMAPQKNEETQD